jgi:hypothetical protein
MVGGVQAASVGAAPVLTRAPAYAPARVSAPVPAATVTAGQFAGLRTRLEPQPAAAQVPAPPVDPATGERGLFDGVTLSRPFEVFSTIATNAVEIATGVRDERYGKAVTHGALAAERGVVSLLRYVAAGRGVVAASSGVLGHVLPLVNIANGVLDIVTGWKSLASHDGGPLAILHSKVGREGVLGVLAGASLLIPGWGGMLASAVFAATSVANDLDAFDGLDEPSSAQQVVDATTARIAHPLDRTPTVAYDPAGILPARA